MAIPLFTFVIGWAKKSECKPIYDRWVMRHGTDPEKWPVPKPNKLKMDSLNHSRSGSY